MDVEDFQRSLDPGGTFKTERRTPGKTFKYHTVEWSHGGKKGCEMES